MHRRWLYWGLPVAGALIGSCHVVYRLLRRHDAADVLDEQIDALIGGVIWFALVKGAGIIFQIAT